VGGVKEPWLEEFQGGTMASHPGGWDQEVDKSCHHEETEGLGSKLFRFLFLWARWEWAPGR
jgi:hypothetical protein